jgi:hypothetical protein
MSMGPTVEQGLDSPDSRAGVPGAPPDPFCAALPEPIRIFGVQLLPLSLGRYRLLKRFGCSFVSDGTGEADMPNLLLGILICSMPCVDFLEFIESPKAGAQLRRWGKRIQQEIKHDRYFTVYQKYALFREYLERSARIPLYWEENDSPASSGAHWSACIESTLRADLGYSKDEIEEGALSKAIEDYFKRAETLGAIRLMTEEEIQMIRAAGEAEIQRRTEEAHRGA